jgi:hypothetical protein
LDASYKQPNFTVNNTSFQSMSEEQEANDPSNTDSTPTAKEVARGYFRRKDSAESDRDASSPVDGKRELYQWLKAAGWAAVAVPVLFYLQFGEISAFGWGATVFLVALCLLVGVGFSASARADSQTSVARGESSVPVVAPRFGWLDRVGAFWLVACGLGPFFGWALASAFTLTANNWRWLYWGRASLSVGLPVLTALPLLRYVRGRFAPLALALLLGVTALPVWSAWATMHDLWSGPSPLVVKARVAGRDDEVYTYLPHTNRVLVKP